MRSPARNGKRKKEESAIYISTNWYNNWKIKMTRSLGARWSPSVRFSTLKNPERHREGEDWAWSILVVGFDLISNFRCSSAINMHHYTMLRSKMTLRSVLRTIRISSILAGWCALCKKFAKTARHMMLHYSWPMLQNVLSRIVKNLRS